MDMYFRILHDEASGELTYLLADQDAREAVLVDPRGRDLPLLAALLAERELRLRWVLRTHQHDPLHAQEPMQLARLGAPRIPVGYANTLETESRVSAAQIAQAATRLIKR